MGPSAVRSIRRFNCFNDVGDEDKREDPAIARDSLPFLVDIVEESKT